MGEDGAQAERSSAPALPEPSASPEPPGSPGAGEAIRDSSQVNAITVLTLLDKLVHMLDSVQEKQEAMEQRQIELEGSVKGIQGDLSKLCKHHTSTSNAVSKLLEKSRKVSAHTREVRERMDRQCAQVKRLESNHAQLLRRNHFKVLIFQVRAGPALRGGGGEPSAHRGVTSRCLVPICQPPASPRGLAQEGQAESGG